MIQTLRITGVAAVAFAGVVLASVLGPVSLIQYGGAGDQRVGKVLAAPGAMDRFQEIHGGKNPVGPEATPPLVKQAEVFKDIIDPRQPVAPPPRPAQTAVARTAAPIVPKETSAKFALIGTSCSPSNPMASLAYLRFPDNTYQWVLCGSEVGHLVIKEVKPDSIVCWDGRRESEVPREIPPDRVSLLETDGPEPASAGTAPPKPVEVKTIGRPPAQPRSMTTPEMGQEDRRAMGDLVERIRMLSGSTGEAGSATQADRVAELSRLISELKSSRVSPEETRKLEDLGGSEPNDGNRATDERALELMRRLNANRTSGN